MAQIVVIILTYDITLEYTYITNAGQQKIKCLFM